jgi:outer membrane protein OmpA-like peptidoglycan-associated protein
MNKVKKKFIYTTFFCFSVLFFCKNLHAQENTFIHINTLKKHSAKVTHVRFSPSGKYLATGDAQGKVCLWETFSQDLLSELQAQTDKITDIVFATDESFFVTTSYDGSILIWEMRQKDKKVKLLKRFQSPTVGAYGGIKGLEPTFAVITPDKEKVFFGGYNRQVYQINLKTKEAPKCIFSNPKYGITAGIITPDENFLAFTYGGEIVFYDIKNEQIAKTLGKHEAISDFGCELDFSHAENKLGVWTVGGQVQFYDLETNLKVGQIQATNLQGSSAFAFSKQGEFILTGHAGQEVLLWDLASKTVKQRLAPHSQVVLALDISSDGRYIATQDGENIKIWSFQNQSDTELEPPFSFEGFEIRKNETLNLKLNFPQSEYVLLPEAIHKLDLLYDFLSKHKNLRIALEGHTDNVGNARLNFELSRNRAKAARNYLISRGIDPKRIEAYGYGASRPLTDNSNETKRQINRRVEMRIL